MMNDANGTGHRAPAFGMRVVEHRFGLGLPERLATAAASASTKAAINRPHPKRFAASEALGSSMTSSRISEMSL